jgi:superfamily II RNA helicase
MEYLNIYNKDEKRIEAREYESCFDYGFELDDFQKEACYRISIGENVFVTAHTGCGKTVVAIYGIANALKMGKKVIYTSPTKSLSNQKYKEFTEKFASTVGILTGDIKVNPEADIIIMTTEILLNMLYKSKIASNGYRSEGSENKMSDNLDISEVGCVIFDEVHYINDPHRGKVWEESLVLLPKTVNIVCLSATIDRPEMVAAWIGRIKEVKINLITTLRRVVPLKHYFFVDNEMKLFIDEGGNMVNYNEIQGIYQKNGFKTIIGGTVRYLMKNRLVPAIFFKFSRKQCEYCARNIVGSLVTHEERKEIESVFKGRMTQYRDLYGGLEDYMRIYGLLQNGIAYHHSGLIPILKEIIEILYGRGLIKVLFATETFAVGVNMPAKTVVFTDLTKYSDGGVRYLRTDEYLQMAGRAGRRGLDKSGTVIVLSTVDFPKYSELRSICTGKSPTISSKFVIGYQFIMKSLLNKTLDMSNLLKNTLQSSENTEEIGVLQKKIVGLKENYEKSWNMEKYNELDEGIRLELEKYLSLNQKKTNNFIKISKKEMKKQNAFKKKVENQANFRGNLAIVSKKVVMERELRDLEDQILGFGTSRDSTIESVLDILREGKFVGCRSDSDHRMETVSDLLEKGHIACELNNCHPLLMADLLEERFFDKCKMEEIVAILAVFIDEKVEFPDVSFKDLKMSDMVLDQIDYLWSGIDYYKKMEVEREIRTDCEYKISLNMVGPAYKWALGEDINAVLAEYPMYAGNFARAILRINSLCDDLINIAQITNNIVLQKQLEGVTEKLIRDAVTVNSLYLDK